MSRLEIRVHLELCLYLECAWSYVGPMKCAWSYVCAFVLVFRVLGVGVTLFRVSLGYGTTKTKTAQAARSLVALQLPFFPDGLFPDFTHPEWRSSDQICN